MGIQENKPSESWKLPPHRMFSFGTGKASIVAIFACWALWLSVEYIAFGNHSLVEVHDNGDSFLAATLSIVSHRGWGFSKWASQFMCGTDRLATPTSTPLDLLVFSMLSGWLAYGSMMILQRFLAGYFSYRVCREVLELDHIASLFCGLAYSLFCQPWLNGEVLGFQLYDGMGLPGIPLLILALAKLRTTRRIWGIAISAVLGVLLGLSSTYALAVFIFAGLAFWFIFIVPRRAVTFWICFASLFVGWVGASIPTVMAGSLNAPQSHRLSWDYLGPRLASPKWAMVTEMAKDNIVLLLIAIIGLFLVSPHSRRLKWLLVAVMGSAAPALVYPPLRASFHQYMGGLAGFQIDRFYQLVPIFVCFASATGLHILHQRLKGYALRGTSVIVIIPVLLIVGESAFVKVNSLRQLAQGDDFQSLYENPELIALSKTMASQSLYRVVTVNEDYLHPAFLWPYGFETGDGYLTLYPNSYKQFWSAVIGPVLQQDAHWRDYFLDWGNRVYLFVPSDTATSAADFSAHYRLNLLSLANVRYVISPIELHADGLVLLRPARPNQWQAWEAKSGRRRLLDVLTGSQPPRALYIYENLSALPRFFTASAGTTKPGETVLEDMQRADVATLRSTALVNPDELLNLPSSNQCRDGRVGVSSYSADRIQLTIDVSAQCVLVATDNYNADWHARLDGAQTPVARVDHTFQGVLVPAGKHELVMQYEPRDFSFVLAKALHWR